MKTVLLVCVAIPLVASLALGQAGSIGIFSDTQGLGCNFYDEVSGLCTFHLVHVLTTGATASQFSAPQPACFQATYLADTGGWMWIGNSQTGVAVSYGTCLTGPIYLLSVDYFCHGLTPSCCYYPVLPDPHVPSGRIEVVDCNGNVVYATGGEGIINPDESCQCDVPVQDTTWGKVKALYQ